MASDAAPSLCFCGEPADGVVEVWMDGDRVATRPRCWQHLGTRPTIAFVERKLTTKDKRP